MLCMAKRAIRVSMKSPNLHSFEKNIVFFVGWTGIFKSHKYKHALFTNNPGANLFI